MTWTWTFCFSLRERNKDSSFLAKLPVWTRAWYLQTESTSYHNTTKCLWLQATCLKNKKQNPPIYRVATAFINIQRIAGKWLGLFVFNLLLEILTHNPAKCQPSRKKNSGEPNKQGTTWEEDANKQKKTDPTVFSMFPPPPAVFLVFFRQKNWWPNLAGGLIRIEGLCKVFLTPQGQSPIIILPNAQPQAAVLPDLFEAVFFWSTCSCMFLSFVKSCNLRRNKIVEYLHRFWSNVRVILSSILQFSRQLPLPCSPGLSCATAHDCQEPLLKTITAIQRLTGKKNSKHSNRACKQHSQNA